MQQANNLRNGIKPASNGSDWSYLWPDYAERMQVIGAVVQDRIAGASFKDEKPLELVPMQ